MNIIYTDYHAGNLQAAASPISKLRYFQKPPNNSSKHHTNITYYLYHHHRHHPNHISSWSWLSPKSSTPCRIPFALS